MESVWQAGSETPKFDILKEDAETDVLIVGGGIAGILCAYKLKNAGVKCILTEADAVCGGVTGYTTAKITFCHSLIYDKLIKCFGEDSARLYLEAEKSACDEYAWLCEGIDCNYEVKDSYVYSLSDRKKIENEINALKRLGVNAELSNAEELPFETAGAVCVKEQAQFHPLKFLYTIARDLPIYEMRKALEFLPNVVRYEGGKIKYKKLIVTTHFPILNKHGAFYLKLYQHRSYVLALKGAKTMRGMYVDESEKGLSFRNYGDLLLLGGGGHRTGKEGGAWRELEEFAAKYYKGSEIAARWATQDCMTLDGVPYIGAYSKSIPDVFVATGFNKWGMTNAMVSANIICDAVMKKENRYAKVFCPSRSILHPQLIFNAFESAVGLLTPGAPRCPHLGCALKYNKSEHTWDCPCHGSRFTENGDLIDNPATGDKENIRHASSDN